MFEKGSQVLKAGYNGFKWDSKTYRIEFAVGEILTGVELDSSGRRTKNLFKIPAIILEEEHLLSLPAENIDSSREWVRARK